MAQFTFWAKYHFNCLVKLVIKLNWAFAFVMHLKNRYAKLIKHLNKS